MSNSSCSSRFDGEGIGGAIQIASLQRIIAAVSKRTSDASFLSRYIIPCRVRMTPGTKVSLGRDFCSFVCLRRAVLDRRMRAASGVGIILIAVAAVLRAGSLAVVSPAGASAGIPIYITGTGFNTAAPNNQVTFKAATGASVVAAGVSIATVDPASGLRRLQVVLPGGLPSGTASVSVKNLVTGEISAGKSLEVADTSAVRSRKRPPEAPMFLSA